MTTTLMRPRFRVPIAALALVVSAFSLVACSDAAEEEGVASIVGATPVGADGSASASGSPSTGSDEEELLSYVQCLRDQGLDVPDPEVDADGNLVLGAGAAGGGGAAGAPPNAEDLEAATQVCGDVPAGVSSQFEQFDTPAFEDALVAFTQCMRDKGYDIADIDTSGGAPGNPLGDLDINDPTVAADLDECQTSVFAGVDVNVPGVGGNG